MEKEAENLILKKGLEGKLSESQLKKLNVLKQKGVRVALFTNLSSNVSRLQNQVGNFEGNHKKIMRLCADSLIGLSQCGDYQGKSFGGFNQLNSYLGSAKYNYIYDNQYSDTSKLRKAGPLYIIRGLESSNPEVRNSAIEAIKILALDYVVFAREESQLQDINCVMFALARTYLDTAPRKKAAARELLEMFQGDKAIIKEIAQSSQIPSGSKQPLFDVTK